MLDSLVEVYACLEIAALHDRPTAEAEAELERLLARLSAAEQALETIATAEDFVDVEDCQAFARAALAREP